MRLCIFRSSRAEKSLLDPIIKQLEQNNEILEVDIRECIPELKIENFGNIYNEAYKFLECQKPDYVLVCADREEIVFVSLAAFHLGIDCIQLYAGERSQKFSTWDDVHRHVISLYSNIHTCTSVTAANRVKKLLRIIGKDTKGVYVVLPTTLDDIEIDENLVPVYPYDVVLYNPCTLLPNEIQSELEEIQKLLDKQTFWIEPNGDLYSKRVEIFAKDLNGVKYLLSLPRPLFLGLLKNCSRFISNSGTTLTYEADYLLKKEQIIPIGIRNYGRDKPDRLEQGGSEQIAKIIDNTKNKVDIR